MIQNFKDGFYLAGVRYWTASLLPALVGTFLPFWLRSNNFTFRPFPAVEFLIASVLLHAGFSFLLAWFEKSCPTNWTKGRILVSAISCIVISCLIGFHIHLNLDLHPHVFKGIFLIFGISALLVGALYVVPPVVWYRRVGGEIVISYSLGLLPLIGAYLVQVGDITRTVYLAALPIVVLTGLWVWILEMIQNQKDENAERKTLVSTLGIRISAQFGVLAISILYFISLLLAVFTASVNPLALILCLLVVPVWKIVNQTWTGYEDLEKLNKARNSAIILHLTTCFVMGISSLNWILIPLPVISW